MIKKIKTSTKSIYFNKYVNELEHKETFDCAVDACGLNAARCGVNGCGAHVISCLANGCAAHVWPCGVNTGPI